VKTIRELMSELRDAVAPRAVALGAGVLMIQLLFILSYVGAFHAVKPQQIPVAVAAPAQVAAQVTPQVAAGLNGIAGQPVHATSVASPAAAQAQVRGGQAAAALVVNPAGSNDTLLVASGGGASLETSVTQVVTAADAAQHRTVTVRDIVPLQQGDARGLTGFYLVVGWLVGGYLAAALLGMVRGARPANTRRAIIRLLALVPYAVASGLGGAFIVDQGLGALTGHFLALWGVGALLVYTASAVTIAFQELAGVLGVGLTVLLFVVAGNPSAGGAYQPALLPPFWRAISYALPNGAATDAIRHIVYFGSQGITGHLLVICGWLAAGVSVALLGTLRRRPGRRSARWSAQRRLAVTARQPRAMSAAGATDR
jgi:hypothetical protein